MDAVYVKKGHAWFSAAAPSYKCNSIQCLAITDTNLYIAGDALCNLNLTFHCSHTVLYCLHGHIERSRQYTLLRWHNIHMANNRTSNECWNRIDKAWRWWQHSDNIRYSSCSGNTRNHYTRGPSSVDAQLNWRMVHVAHLTLAHGDLSYIRYILLVVNRLGMLLRSEFNQRLAMLATCCK